MLIDEFIDLEESASVSPMPKPSKKANITVMNEPLLSNMDSSDVQILQSQGINNATDEYSNWEEAITVNQN